jgi:hypothetical protein
MKIFFSMRSVLVCMMQPPGCVSHARAQYAT